MTVYVDPLFRVKDKGYFCHLFADTPQELQDCEHSIGVHGIHSMSSRVRDGHHIINTRQRLKAISWGAVEVTPEQFQAHRVKKEETVQRDLAAEKKARVQAYTGATPRQDVWSIKML